MSDMIEQPITGGCLCGVVRYEVKGQPLIVAHCHCSDCQRVSGAGHTTGAMFSADNFSLTGKVAEYKLMSNNGNEVTRVFCPACGSSLYGRNSGAEEYLTITLGTLDDSSRFEPDVTVFARNRKSWDVMDEAIPTFGTQPAWKPNDGL